MYIVAPLTGLTLPLDRHGMAIRQQSERFAISGPSFETRCFAPLLRMRGVAAPAPQAPARRRQAKPGARTVVRGVADPRHRPRRCARQSGQDRPRPTASSAYFVSGQPLLAAVG